jgi:putative hemolysin
MANFLLERVNEVKNKLILVNSLNPDDPNPKNIGPLKEILNYLKQGGLLGVFPSGEVASFNIKTGKINEPEWNPHISRIIQKTGAAVVPIYFHGRNSVLFQMAGILHARLRTSLLIREMMHPPTTRLIYKIGSVIPPEKIAGFKSDTELTQFLRSRTYLLGENIPTTTSKLRLRNPLKFINRRDFEKIIPPLAPEVLLGEIQNIPTAQRLYTQKDFEVFVFTANQAPSMLMEIARLREITFRAVGEGTGKSHDLDNHDRFYHHLVVWNTANNEIVGAYRLALCDEVIAKHGQKGLYLNTLFDIKAEFYKQVSPAIELGRSFVRQEYQRNFLSLMLLWIGIGRFVLLRPEYRYLIGPVTISNSFSLVSQTVLIRFLRDHYYLSDYADLVKPRLSFRPDEKYEQAYYKPSRIGNLNDVQEVIAAVEEQSGARVPVLIKHYLKLGSKVLEFNVDPDFQNCVDALMLTDLTMVEVHTLRKYMGDDGAERYLKYQRERHLHQFNEFSPPPAL